MSIISRQLSSTLLGCSLLFSTLLFQAPSAKAQENTKERTKIEVVRISTDQGDIWVYLYPETPIHRENFLRLADEKVYDKTTFHRVIKGFMIQGGDPLSKDDDTTNDGTGGPPMVNGYPYMREDVVEAKGSYTIPAEFNANLYHKYGALAAARTGGPGNPELRSSGSQFYIAVGQKYSDADLDRLAGRGIKLSDAARADYKTIGGIPFLDGTYTVFGEVLEGMDVVEKIIQVPKNKQDRPLKDQKMKMKVYKLSPKKARKKFKGNAAIEKEANQIEMAKKK